MCCSFCFCREEKDRLPIGKGTIEKLCSLLNGTRKAKRMNSRVDGGDDLIDQSLLDSKNIINNENQNIFSPNGIFAFWGREGTLPDMFD